ncbi:serine/threonine-protein phosphatase 7 long form homolog [Amaranthus tricolor]|uniref:serine/threonine-protein phosphatase 7 long form homolog n=1 Tax=Amaranthus tricolor TaxID=29722 RepID=UPI002585D5F3|nr:serine/threonine-protein phosphatase 7 long form homolog [Amaranthus tricolor]
MDPAAPGPLDPSVLTMQASHRSSVLWDVKVSDTETIYTRHPDSAPWAIDARIVPYLQLARLHDFHLIATCHVHRCTPVRKLARQSPKSADDATVERYARAYLLYLIGAVLFSDKTGNRVQLLYLTLLDAPWEVISGYSWGSAALAYLYRRLCEASQKNVKEIAGPLIILQLWAWEHVLIGQPMRSVGRGAFAPPLLPPPHVPYGSRWSFERRTRTHTGSGVGFYRDQLDLLRADQVTTSPQLVL